MLADAATIAAVCDALARHAPGVPLVRRSGDGGERRSAAAGPSAVGPLMRRLLPLASVITPNLPEAEVLAGMPIADIGAMHQAAEALLALGVPAVLLKGGHLPGATGGRPAGDRGWR